MEQPAENMFFKNQEDDEQIKMKQMDSKR